MSKPQQQAPLYQPEGVAWSPLLEKINDLLLEEKETRHETDAFKMSEVCRRVLTYTFEQKEHTMVRELLEILVKRRGQAKKAIVDMVHTLMDLLKSQVTDRKLKYSYLETLRGVTDGKLYLEVEYARLTLEHCQMLHADGDVQKAANTLSDVQVETYSSMDKQEKVAYICTQLEMMIETGDWVKVQIISRRLNRKLLKDQPELKVRFLRLLNLYHIHEENRMEAARGYQEIYNTIEERGAPKHEAFENFAIFVMLASHSNERHDFLHILTSEFYGRELELSHPVLHKFVKKFQGSELMGKDEQLEKEMSAFAPFQKEAPCFDARHFQVFETRIIHHNLLVFQKYYSHIALARISTLLGIKKDEVETQIAEMVSAGMLEAKINRLSAVVHFKPQAPREAQVDEWNQDVKKLMSLLDHTCYLINRVSK